MSAPGIDTSATIKTKTGLSSRVVTGGSELFSRIKGNAEREEKIPEYKSKWDQFCDFTSLVGFRLLHSKNPIWLRYPGI